MATIKVQQSLWNVVGGSKYDPDKFYTKSTDSNGHYENVPRTKVTPSMEAFVSELMGEFPTEYKSQGDVIRDALMHLVVYRKHNMTGAQATVRVDVERELAMARMDEMIGALKAWETYVSTVRDSVATLVENRQWNLVAEVLQSAEEKCDDDEVPETIRVQLKTACKDGWEQMRTEIAQRRKRVIED